MKAALGGRTPAEVAHGQTVAGCKLMDPKPRGRPALEGGLAAVARHTDPMIALSPGASTPRSREIERFQEEQKAALLRAGPAHRGGALQGLRPGRAPAPTATAARCACPAGP